MLKVIVRRLLGLLLTLVVASMTVFLITELMPTDLANKVLGQFATPEQKERWRERNGMNEPAPVRYVNWLIGNDWRVGRYVDYDLIAVRDNKTGDPQWWALADDGSLLRWTMEAGDLVEVRRAPAGEGDLMVALNGGRIAWLCEGEVCRPIGIQTDGEAQSLAELRAQCGPGSTQCAVGSPSDVLKVDSIRRNLPVSCADDSCWRVASTKEPAGEVWTIDAQGRESFWGVDTDNHVVMWQREAVIAATGAVAAGQAQTIETGGVKYYPLQRGLLRGDPGRSFLTGRPVASTIFARLGNSAWLAGIAFLIIMPLALLLGVIAGLKEGSFTDRLISILGLITTATPEFTTGVLLILLFVITLKPGLPGAVTLMPGETVLSQPRMMILPVLTLMTAEVGYVARMTRASIVEVMSAPYVRTAVLKGLPQREIVMGHVLRNGLIAPITVIMLHVNWLLGGIVVVESLFGYPGLGTYLLEAALFGDIFAIEAGAMIMVTIAVGTQVMADIVYAFLNPRIRYV